MSADARRLWIRYQNECEVHLAPEGDFADVRDVAAKSAENACRLAAIFHVWHHGPVGTINSANMERGVAIARWFLYEARRVLCTSTDHASANDAELLARWVHSCAEPPSLKIRFGLLHIPCANASAATRPSRSWSSDIGHVKSSALVGRFSS